MKNKKLIATVASLCLVLVAVVAAVVGVLAAARQNVSSKVKVTYTATNVGAEVSINSRLQYGTFGEEQDEATFYTGNKTKTEELSVVSSPLALAWQGVGQTSEGELNYYALYRFTFTNTSTNNNMSITLNYNPNYEENSQNKSIENNVQLKWYSSTSVANPTFAKPTYTSDTSFASITTPTDLTLLELTNGSVKCHNSVAKVANSTATTVYVFLVVLVNNVDADASFDMTEHGSIQFVLDAIEN